MRLLRLVPLLALVLAAPALAAETTLAFRGYAYDLKSGAFLYTELHRQRIDGERWLGGTIDYYGANGAKLGGKVLDFTADPHIPVYRLELKARGGYVEGIDSVSPDAVGAYKQGYGEDETVRKRLRRKGPSTGDSGFHAFIRDNFATLLKGEPFAFTFVVAGNLDTFKFRARRIQDGRFEGKPTVRFQVEANSLLRLVAPSLEVAYDPVQRQLLEYRGISNIHDPVTGDPYNVRIIYPSKPPADAPRLPEP